MSELSIEPDIPGPEHSGKWIAWDDSQQHIVACATTLREAETKAIAAGIIEPTLELVPPVNQYFVGGV